MRFKKGTKPHLGACKQAGRYAMHGVSLEVIDAKRSQLVATNGRSLTVIPARTEPGDHTGIVPPELVKATATAPVGELDPAIQLQRDCKVSTLTKNGELLGREIDGEFPKWKSMVRSMPDPVRMVGLDLQLLAQLGKSLGTRYALLMLPEETEHKSTAVHPIRVIPMNGSVHGREYPCADPEAWGVIMPVTVDADQHPVPPVLDHDPLAGFLEEEEDEGGAS